MFIWMCGKKREGRIVRIVVLDYGVAKQRAIIGEEDVVRWIRHIDTATTATVLHGNEY